MKADALRLSSGWAAHSLRERSADAQTRPALRQNQTQKPAVDPLKNRPSLSEPMGPSLRENRRASFT